MVAMSELQRMQLQYLDSTILQNIVVTCIKPAALWAQYLFLKQKSHCNSCQKGTIAEEILFLNRPVQKMAAAEIKKHWNPN